MKRIHECLKRAAGQKTSGNPLRHGNADPHPDSDEAHVQRGAEPVEHGTRCAPVHRAPASLPAVLLDRTEHRAPLDRRVTRYTAVTVSEDESFPSRALPQVDDAVGDQRSIDVEYDD